MRDMDYTKYKRMRISCGADNIVKIYNVLMKLEHMMIRLLEKIMFIDVLNYTIKFSSISFRDGNPYRPKIYFRYMESSYLHYTFDFKKLVIRDRTIKSRSRKKC